MQLAWGDFAIRIPRHAASLISTYRPHIDTSALPRGELPVDVLAVLRSASGLSTWQSVNKSEAPLKSVGLRLQAGHCNSSCATAWDLKRSAER